MAEVVGVVRTGRRRVAGQPSRRANCLRRAACLTCVSASEMDGGRWMDGVVDRPLGHGGGEGRSSAEQNRGRNDRCQSVSQPARAHGDAREQKGIGISEDSISSQDWWWWWVLAAAAAHRTRTPHDAWPAALHLQQQQQQHQGTVQRYMTNVPPYTAP